MSRISAHIRSARGGFAIFLAIALTILILLIGVYLIDKLLPASKSVKGVEHGNVAYYQAASAVEMALSSLSAENPGTETGGTVGSLSWTGYSFSTLGSGTVVPKPGFGNSEYAGDHNWNVIAQGRPVQLKLPAGMNPAVLAVELRVPDVDRNGKWGEGLAPFDDPNEALSGGTLETVNWIIVGSGETLMSSDSQTIEADQVNLTAPIDLSSRTGSTLNNGTGSFAAFGNDYCVTPAFRCTFKLSVTRPLVTVGGRSIPYLEYRITAPAPIPQQWMRVSAEGYSRGFKQTVVREMEQATVSEALDFTVFQ